MTKSLRILHLEDNPLDSEIVQLTLAAEGIVCEAVRVDTQADFRAALDEGGYDLILADYLLPSFTGVQALGIAKDMCPDVPFIILSGSLGEEVAIETLKSGATDYVLKHRLARLVPSVRRALDEAETRLERRRLEEQLRHAQKMDCIGALAGGIAHDFNNLLTAIIGNAQLGLVHLHPGSALHEQLTEIEKAGRRAADLTRQLLIFSRRQELKPKATDLNATVGDFMKILRRIIGENVEVLFLQETNLHSVFADSGQIEQVVMNLAVNARDAMPDGGQLKIETSNVVLDEKSCSERLWARPGTYARIAVSDTGEGMDADVQQRVFEPFFTTKGVGKGTGLGLAVVYGIVKDHAGLIEVRSQRGQGTTVEVYLPAQEKTVEETIDAVAAAPRGGAETILVAEDEPGLRALARMILEGLGYRVMLASDGYEAVRLLIAHREEIDLAILDVVMPRLGGREVYDQIRALGNYLPIVFMTGYSAETAQNKLVGEIDATFIQKPYSVDSLGRKVREVLDTCVLAQPARCTDVSDWQCV